MDKVESQKHTNNLNVYNISKGAFVKKKLFFLCNNCYIQVITEINNLVNIYVHWNSLLGNHFIIATPLL